MNNLNEKALELHKNYRGKIEVHSKVPLKTRADLSIAHTPGVSAPCLEIAKNPDDAYTYTSKGNLVAILTNGSAVLGLGNIGSLASMPVMEGKSLLFKEFGGVDAFPICINANNNDEIIKFAQMISPTFGGINLEDIKAPDCFIIEKALKETLDIPIFNDDQHGAAIVCCAALLNALKLADKSIDEVKIVINGAGSAGTAIAKLISTLGGNNIILVDTKGAIASSRDDLNVFKKEVSYLNINDEVGSIHDVIKGADVFIGVSVANVLSEIDIKNMNDKSIVFAMANPIPEILPDVALGAGCFIVGTGRSDYNNQINNVLAYPGVFRGTLDAMATDINEEMKISAVYAISELVTDDLLSPDYIIPSALDLNVAPHVAGCVANSAVLSNVARKNVTYDQVYKNTLKLTR